MFGVFSPSKIFSLESGPELSEAARQVQIYAHYLCDGNLVAREKQSCLAVMDRSSLANVTLIARRYRS